LTSTLTFRRWFAAALLACVAISASVPHTHSLLDLADRANERGDEAQIIQCHASQSAPAHYDAARLVHHAECHACLREHHQRAGSTSFTVFVAAVFAAPLRPTLAPPRPAAAPVVHLRAPPTVA
jgi:hypothetical protein